MDVQRIRSHPLVPRDIPIYGYIYDVANGRLVEVPEATQIGKAARADLATLRPHGRRLKLAARPG